MASRPPPLEQIDVTPGHVHALLARVRPQLSDEEYREIEALIETLLYVADIVTRKTTSIARLRALLFGACTETTRDVLARAGVTPEMPSPGGEAPPDQSADQTTGPAAGQPPRAGTRRGHGRHGATAYAGAQRITIPHPHLHPGDACPRCDTGTVYRQRDPKVLVRFVGQAPIGATVYGLERLRCHLCGDVFTAPAPDGVGDEKYDATSGAMIALLKYGSGVPFYRLEQLQANVALPLAASTQWEIVADVATRIQPALNELIRHAANGEVLHNDDTSMTVLSLLPKKRKDAPAVEPATVDDVSPDRTGVFTSGIVATRDGHRIALYVTGRRHAGENLATVLAHRAPGLGPPIQMCDALSRNPPKAFEVILAHCLSHARRHIVNVTPNFPTECRHVLETLRDVYHYDAQARERGLSPAARLSFHQTHSRPLMDALHTWLTAQLDEHRVEPNSGLGQAITYFVKHWTPLTRFLEIPGAPLDNNLVERALKKAILHRKGALFYKTLNGARVGDLFMSVIHTCELNGVNPFAYLIALQRHADALKETPGAWLPWTYRETLQQLEASTEAA
jgi:transposase